MPTVEEVAHEFANSYYFTKLNACHGYWSIVLEEESSLLTTFNSPFWRYCFLHLTPWSGLLTRHLPDEDGPVPQRLPWMYQNCWWHHCTWLHWGRTWCPPAEPHVGKLQVWSCVQSTENACKDPSSKLFLLPIWCQWCPLRPRQGWCCACSPSTHECHWTPRVPWHGDISQPLCPWPVHSWKKMPTLPRMPAMRPLFSKSSKPSSVTPPSDTLTCHCLWLYKSMPHR